MCKRINMEVRKEETHMPKNHKRTIESHSYENNEITLDTSDLAQLYRQYKNKPGCARGGPCGVASLTHEGQGWGLGHRVHLSRRSACSAHSPVSLACAPAQIRAGMHGQCGWLQWIREHHQHAGQLEEGHMHWSVRRSGGFCSCLHEWTLCTSLPTRRAHLTERVKNSKLQNHTYSRSPFSSRFKKNICMF